MTTVAIISEYNPFHNGHKYMIDEIRKMFSEDVAIISIMSGNFTQRGELAIADKTVRAKTAVLCGVDLVLELPFPFCCSSAEIFARSGVKIADAIGADYLVFGSECGDIATLSRIAENMTSSAFESVLQVIRDDRSQGSLGYPQMLEMAYRALYPSEELDISASNNILGLEYIKAIKYFASSITPLTIKREGAKYLDDSINENEAFQSATALRCSLVNGNNSASKYMPEKAYNEFLEAKSNGLAPASINALSAAFISKFRLNSSSNIKIHDADDGLYNRLCTLSMRTNSISTLSALAETKKYTRSRINRAILYSFFGVTSSIVNEYPHFTQVLAMNDIGRSVLKGIKKCGFPCITKPADYTAYSDEVISQKELANKADSIYALALPGDISGAFPLTFTPFVKK